MSHSSATVWKCCGHHWQSTLSRNTTWFQAYFLLWNKQETPLWNRQPFWFSSIRTYWSSSNQNPNRWKKVFSIALWSHCLNRLQDGIGESFGLCGIKACSSGQQYKYSCESWDHSRNYRMILVEAVCFLDQFFMCFLYHNLILNFQFNCPPSEPICYIILFTTKWW